MRYDVAIIGGGIAGSSAAIHLARRGVSVLLLEKKQYPRHKLCGEFLSPEVTASFQRLGVLDAIHGLAPQSVHKVLVTSASGARFEHELPGYALGLSRYRLDRLLFQHAGGMGVDAQVGRAVRGINGDLENGFCLRTRDAVFHAQIVLGAWGKHSILDRKTGRQKIHHRSPYVAFKAHYTGSDVSDAIELHAFPGGYCGLIQVEEGRTNACWISHERVLKAAGSDPEKMIEQAFCENEALRQRFAGMERITESFCAVSQVLVTEKTTFGRDICMIGDTAGMIAPLCGGGMAMALRSAELAAPRAHAMLEGRFSPKGFRHSYDTAWCREFGFRMRLGRWMHHAYMHPVAAGLGLQLCQAVPALGRWMIANTRGLALR